MRREMPEWAVLPPNASEKTTTIVHSNFTSYPADVSTRLAEHDACIWALGKSSLGFSEADYTVLTYDYPMALIRTLKEAGVGENRPKDKPFRFVYISGEHADTTEKSSQMWARVKVHIVRSLILECHRLTIWIGTRRKRPNSLRCRISRNQNSHSKTGLLPPR